MGTTGDSMNLIYAIRQEMKCVVHDARYDLAIRLPCAKRQLDLAIAIQERMEQLIRDYGKESD